MFIVHAHTACLKSKYTFYFSHLIINFLDKCKYSFLWNVNIRFANFVYFTNFSLKIYNFILCILHTEQHKVYAQKSDGKLCLWNTWRIKFFYTKLIVHVTYVQKCSLRTYSLFVKLVHSFLFNLEYQRNTFKSWFW